jgi:hypothetical protein
LAATDAPFTYFWLRAGGRAWMVVAEVIMRHIFLALCASTLVYASPLHPQTSTKTNEQLNASYEAHKGDFDYLLGDWEFTAKSQEHGDFRGLWSAVRLAEGQILDEYRAVGDKGETYYVTSTLRNYNKALGRWELIGADAGGGLQDFGTAHRVGSEVHIEQRFGVTSERPSTMKIRYYNIQRDRFSWTGDRSVDGGKTWEKNHLQIEARRIGPPRSLGPLTRSSSSSR